MRKLALLALLPLFALPLFAQPKLDVNVKQINDRRTNGSFAQLTLTLELPKVPSPDVAASRVLVSTAVDDTGRNLIDAERGEAELETNRSGMMSPKEVSPATVSVTLKNPDRKAVAVKQIAGEIELYMPSKDPNSIAEIPKFLSQAGKTLSHKALKANGVEIAPLSATQIAAERKRLSDAKRKEATEAGMTGEDLENYVKTFEGMQLNLEPSDVLVRIKDPNKRIQDMSYVDAAGEVKHLSRREDEGLYIFSTWEKVQPDWKLRVSMKTPKNIARYAFALANVPLP